MMKNLIIITVFFLANFGFFAQENPVKWKITYNHETSAIIYNATIGLDWHLYAAHLPSPEEGPLPTEFKYDTSDYYQLNGKVLESKPIKTFDDNFGVDVSYFENTAEFSQGIKLTSAEPFVLTGTIYYMVCNEQMCIPFEDNFDVKINP